jgi:rubrerythrin
MSEKDLSLAQSVRLAADTELKSVDFYRNAAQKASRESLKRLLNGLADFEQLHYDQVMALALSLQKEGKFLFYEGCSMSIPAQSAIEVSPEAREALEATRLSLMAVITAAQEVEVHAAKSYAELANQVSDPDTGQGGAATPSLADRRVLEPERPRRDRVAQSLGERPVACRGRAGRRKR